MKLKSFFLTLMALVVSLSAYAFPTVEISYPSPSEPVDEVQYLSSISIAYSETGVKINSDKIPYFYNEETGDEVYASQFKDFVIPGLGSTPLLSFDENQFKDNGTWTLIFPAGSFTYNSEESPRLTFSFVLADPNLAAGSDFPQITLISVTPANETTHPSFGGELFDKMTFVTSDDSAVNYIEWQLDDVTNGETPDKIEYMRSGNENRFDPNRTGNNDDQWADGLFVTISSQSTPLIEGHKYKVSLKFCGIGYNLSTGQYPSPSDITRSLELETAVYYLGQTKATEYSPYTVEAVNPNPDEYEIEYITQNEFMVTYTGPVKPTKFIYATGFGTSPAGTYRPEDDEDGDGYASVWTFIFDDSVLQGALGQLDVTICASDANGLPVKGNGGYMMDDFDYMMSWRCNLGADNLVSVAPEDYAEVEELASITVACENNKIIAYSWNAAEPAQILSQANHSVIRQLDMPVQSDDELSVTWEFEPITEPGTYILHIPSYYFALGTEFDGVFSKSTNFTYIIEGEVPGSAVFDLQPKEVTPADGAKVEKLDMIKVEFAETTFAVLNADYELTKGSLYMVGEGGAETLVEEVEPMDDLASDFFNPTIYDYTLANAVDNDATYKFVIPQGTFGDEAFDTSDRQNGHANPEIVLNYIVGNGGGGIASIIAAGSTADIYSISGTVVVRNAGIDDLRALESGIYVINGKKVIIRK